MQTDPSSSDLLRAAMTAQGMATDLELAHAVSVRLPRDAGVSQLTARRWLNGEGIPDRVLLALCAALPTLDFTALTRALAVQAATEKGMLPTVSREW